MATKITRNRDQAQAHPWLYEILFSSKTRSAPHVALDLHPRVEALSSKDKGNERSPTKEARHQGG